MTMLTLMAEVRKLQEQVAALSAEVKALKEKRGPKA